MSRSQYCLGYQLPITISIALPLLAGDLPSKKLAVRLLPRFWSAFQDLFEATSSSLSELACTGLNTAEASSNQGLRLSALEALGIVALDCCQWPAAADLSAHIMGKLLW